MSVRVYSFKPAVTVFCSLLLMTLWTLSGCSEGTVPNSPPDDIEAAKFDPEDAKNKGIGAAAPPE